MSVQNTADRIRNRFIRIITLYQDSVYAGNRTFFKGPRPFQESREFRINGRRIPSRNRRFSRCQTDFSLRHGKTGQRVHHKEHIHPLISEIFRYRGCNKRCFQSEHGRLIGGSHYQDGTLHPLFSHILFHEFQNFSTTLSHQCNDVDVRFDISRNHAHKRGFSDTGSRKDADTLSFSHGI